MKHVQFTEASFSPSKPEVNLKKSEVKTPVYLVRMDYGGAKSKYSWLLTLREEKVFGFFFPFLYIEALCSLSQKHKSVKPLCADNSQV